MYKSVRTSPITEQSSDLCRPRSDRQISIPSRTGRVICLGKKSPTNANVPAKTKSKPQLCGQTRVGATQRVSDEEAAPPRRRSRSTVLVNATQQNIKLGAHLRKKVLASLMQNLASSFTDQMPSFGRGGAGKERYAAKRSLHKAERVLRNKVSAKSATKKKRTPSDATTSVQRQSVRERSLPTGNQ